MSSMALFFCVWICLQMVASGMQGHPHQNHSKPHKLDTYKDQTDVSAFEPARSDRMINRATRYLPFGQSIQEMIGKIAANQDLDTSDTSESSESSGSSFMSNLIVFIVYAILVCAFAWWYHSFEGKSYFLPKEATPEGKALQISEPHKTKFNVGLFTCFDEPVLCCLSCCCGAVRWSDTMEMAGQISFLVGMVIFLVSYLLSAFDLPGFTILAITCAVKRQGLRLHFEMESYGTCGSIWEDLFTYLCCAPCAIVQEARQVESYSAENVLKSMKEIGEAVAVNEKPNSNGCGQQ